MFLFVWNSVIFNFLNLEPFGIADLTASTVSDARPVKCEAYFTGAATSTIAQFKSFKNAK